MSQPRVLFVDDEPNVLVGVTRALRGRFELLLATSGPDALQQVAAGPVDVVVSDMRMPEMDGASFLARVRALSPDTVRLVMSGHADLEASIRAINEGQVFRFLVKPVKRELLAQAIEAALEQRRLLLAERELLERTLTGAVDALSEGLALTSPVAFGRSRRLKQLASALASELALPRRWAIEVAAMLCQLGAASLPPETLHRWYRGGPLTPAERSMTSRVNLLGRQLLAHIPRLEEVVELIGCLEEGAPPSTGGLPSRVLQAADGLERHLAREGSLAQAIDALSAAGGYDPVVLEAARRLRGLLSGQGAVRELDVGQVRPGMVLAEPVLARSGALLMARGHIVSEGVLTCLRSFAASVGLREPLLVLVPEEPSAPQA